MQLLSPAKVKTHNGNHYRNTTGICDKLLELIEGNIPQCPE